MTLPPETALALDRLSEEGNNFFDEEKYDQAIECWKSALQLLPTPVTDWEAAMWLFASIGDAHYQQGHFLEAKDAFHDALNAPDGNANPFVLFRLGQAYDHLGDEQRAVDFLLRAYMLDGQEIFDSDPDGALALNLLASRQLIKIV